MKFTDTQKEHALLNAIINGLLASGQYHTPRPMKEKIDCPDFPPNKLARAAEYQVVIDALKIFTEARSASAPPESKAQDHRP